MSAGKTDCRMVACWQMAKSSSAEGVKQVTALTGNLSGRLEADRTFGQTMNRCVGQEWSRRGAMGNDEQLGR